MVLVKQKHLFQFVLMSLLAAALMLVSRERLAGLDPGTPANEYLLDQWSTAEGLPSTRINSIAPTPDGYLWLATAGGLVRFDGQTFVSVPFLSHEEEENGKSTYPDVLFLDKDGSLWIGSTAGLTRYRYDTGEFKTYTKKDGLAGDRIRRIFEDQEGNLWISLWVNYLNRFDKTREIFTHYNSDDGLTGKKINAILQDRNGVLLAGTRENGVFAFHGERFSRLQVQDLKSHHLVIMYEDSGGRLWIGTSGGLFLQGREGKQDRIFTTRHGLSGDFIIAIGEDSDGNLWIGTTSGLDRLSPGDWDGSGAVSFQHVFDDKGIIVPCFFEDREGSLWIGTDDSGLKRLREDKFMSFPGSGGKRLGIILSMFQDPAGNIWLGALNGVLHRYGRDRTLMSMPFTGAAGTGLSALAQDGKGNFWVGTFGKGVFYREKGAASFKNLTTKDGLADNTVHSIFFDSKGNAWFSTQDGVSRYNGSSMATFKNDMGLVGSEVRNVYEDRDGCIWIATNKGITVLKDGQFDWGNQSRHLEGVSVSCICEDTGPGNEGLYWVSTHGAGLKRLQNGRVTSYTVENGMPTNFIYQMLEDQMDHLWMVSGVGVLRVNKHVLNDITAGRAHRVDGTYFGVSDGMESIDFYNNFSRHSVMKTLDNRFWFTSKQEIAIVDPARIRINRHSPPVIIEQLLLTGNSSSDRLLTTPQLREPITLTNTHRWLFRFTAPSFLSPEKIVFKYILERYDKNWHYLRPGTPRTADYRNLTPGTYTFRVTAANSDGVWNQTGASVTFTLKPEFVQTILFKVLLALTLLALTAAVYFGYKKWGDMLVKRRRSRDRYKSSHLQPAYVKEVIKKLTYRMEVEKTYRDEELSLQVLAEKLSVTPHHLSQILNEKLNKGFSDYINTYRIEEAKKLLTDAGSEHRKILTIAFDVGFNTKAAFNYAFKKYTNMTPTQYRKKHLDRTRSRSGGAAK